MTRETRKGVERARERENERDIARRAGSSRATNQFTLSLVHSRSLSRGPASSRPPTTRVRTRARVAHAMSQPHVVYARYPTHHTRSQLHSRPERCSGSELALFYRKGLIALPITDNATINDLGEEGAEQREGRAARRDCSEGSGGGRERERAVERERERECPVALPLHRLGSPAYTRNDVCNGASTL